MIKTLEPLQDSKSLSPMSRRFTVIRNDIPYNIAIMSPKPLLKTESNTIDSSTSDTRFTKGFEFSGFVTKVRKFLTS